MNVNLLFTFTTILIWNAVLVEGSRGGLGWGRNIPHISSGTSQTEWQRFWKDRNNDMKITWKHYNKTGEWKDLPSYRNNGSYHLLDKNPKELRQGIIWQGRQNRWLDKLLGYVKKSRDEKLKVGQEFITGGAAEYIGCKQNHCLHNGTCLEGDGKKLCICPTPWTGQHCQTSIQDACPDMALCSVRCHNGYNINRQFNCETCECASHPCQTVSPCRTGQTCVAVMIQIRLCRRDRSGICVNTKRLQPICRAVIKPGKCPSQAIHHMENLRNQIQDASTPSQFLDWAARLRIYNQGPVSAPASCQLACHSDSDCAGLDKCCSTGCGAHCTMAFYFDTSPCKMEVEKYRLGDRSRWHTPTCDQSGQYTVKQCGVPQAPASGASSRTPAEICYCVDPLFGHNLPGTFNISSGVSCLQRLSQSRLTCGSPQCEFPCQFGFRHNQRGCRTCQCMDNPCNTTVFGEVCAKNEVCLSIPAEKGCDDCTGSMYCVGSSYVEASCFTGSVLRHHGNILVGCNPTTVTERIAPCPHTHYCQHHDIPRDSLYQQTLMEEGICCLLETGDP